MPRFHILPGALLVIPALLGGAWSAADEYAEKCRAVAASHGDTVVTIELVIEISMNMMGMAERTEEKTNAIGTVAHPDGWILLTNAAVDPAGQYASMLSMMPDGMSIESRVTGARIRYADGTEADGRVVLRDGDRDLALLKPVDALGAPVPFVDFSQATAIEMFDPAVILSRLGRVARYQLAGYPSRIEAVIDRPRTLYVMNGPAGAPVFNLDGEPVGICAQRTFGGAGMTSMRDFEDNIMSVIVPGADLVEFLEEGKDAVEPVDGDTAQEDSETDGTPSGEAPETGSSE
jgi:S1-C subfamily serine protease